jgi:hypothetical protein
MIEDRVTERVEPVTPVTLVRLHMTCLSGKNRPRLLQVLVARFGIEWLVFRYWLVDGV